MPIDWKILYISVPGELYIFTAQRILYILGSCKESQSGKSIDLRVKITLGYILLLLPVSRVKSGKLLLSESLLIYFSLFLNL